MREAYVHEAELVLDPDVDPGAPGGAVTVALCGHWEHEGACRWPHNSDIDASVRPARFRTVFAAPVDEEPEVRARIERALREADSWTLLRSAARDVSIDEAALAHRLVEH
jgi:hypothetical protein